MPIPTCSLSYPFSPYLSSSLCYCLRMMRAVVHAVAHYCVFRLNLNALLAQEADRPTVMYFFDELEHGTLFFLKNKTILFVICWFMENEFILLLSKYTIHLAMLDLWCLRTKASLWCYCCFPVIWLVLFSWFPVPKAIRTHWAPLHQKTVPDTQCREYS